VLPEPSDPTEVSLPKSEAPASGRPVPRPPVSGVAATMIGVAPPRARAGTSPLGVPRAPVLAEPRAPGTPFTLPPNPLSARQSETRVPGASFTLPANPLSEMNATDLGSFIDSTLFESDDEDATAERAARPSDDDDKPTERAVPAQPVEPASAASAASAASDRPEPTERTHAPSPLAAFAPGSGGARDPRRIAMRLLPYAVCIVAGVVIGHAIRHAPPAPTVEAAKPAPPPATPAEAAPAALPVAPTSTEAAKPAPPPAQEEAKPEAPARAAPAEAPAPPVRERHAAAGHAARGADAAGDCQVNVVTEPPDAKIAWRGKPLGATPLAEAAIPCGEGALTITHERYETVTKTLTAAAGAPVALDERLHRPPATLVVTSSPAGAAISLNGHPVGTAPRRVPTLRYEHLTIRATLPGYAPWTKKIYLTAETLQVTAQLAGGHKR
jgi:PEGA domain